MYVNSINSHDTSRQLLKVHIGGKKHLPKKILCNDNDNGDSDKEKAKARTPKQPLPRCQMPNPKDQRPRKETKKAQ